MIHIYLLLLGEKKPLKKRWSLEYFTLLLLLLYSIYSIRTLLNIVNICLGDFFLEIMIFGIDFTSRRPNYHLIFFLFFLIFNF